MKNLKLLLNLKIQNDLFLDSKLIICGQSLQGNDLSHKLKNVFVISNDCLYSVGLISRDATKYYDLRNLFPDNVPRVISMWYRDLYNSIFICFESGVIFSLVLENNGVQHCRQSHDFDCNISQIYWSPDEELALAVCDNEKLILFNSEFFSLSEINLRDTYLGENELISVGWGKKETQFHGSEGKNAALSKPSIIDPSFVDDDHSVQITWRGDSGLFAFSFWCYERNTRMVKVYNTDGILQSISEDLPGINEPISWKPSGNLIALPQQLPNKKVIAFLEKNGLKHGDFTLPKHLKVKFICWNEASTILCTVCENQQNLSEEVLLWTTANYHWYIKQKFKFTTTSRFVWWDKERSNRLYAVCEGGILQIIEWTFTVFNSYSSLHEERSYVGVIDNESILLTSFKEAIVPPPMSSYILKCQEAINYVMFPPNHGEQCSYLLCAVLSNGNLALFKDPVSDPLIIPDLVQKFNFSIEMASLSHWEWVAPDTLICCSSGEQVTFIHQFSINKESLELRNVLEFIGNIITCNRSSDDITIQKTDGKLFKYNTDSMEVTEDFCLVEPCHDIKVHSIGLFCLSELSRLYFNNTQISLPSISGRVTSFLLKDPYILVTTTSHKLVILQCINSSTVEISDRKLERGSKLIVTCGNSVVLQAPRGNLETIQPRALTILTLGSLIDSKDYKTALSLMRKQRIDLNLIIDYNQKLFIEEVNNFVNQVDPQWITLLITELSSENVTQNMYKLYFEKKIDAFNGTKINSVCEALLSVMSSSEPRKKYIFPMLSALVKIGKMSEAIKLANNEQAMQHLMFIVDSNKLYLEALGVYDLDAALKIAEKSQKDPKEYIPYLNSLKSMESNYMKYTIDKTLKRFKSALMHIVECCDEHEEECLNLIEENSLYSEALKLFKNDPNRYIVISFKYGDYLFKQRRYEESGIMYLRGGNKEKAIHSFTRAGNWRQCMIILMDSNFSAEERINFAENICNVLISAHKYVEAATMYIEWLEDVDKAVEMYVQGKCWREAIYISKKFGKPDLIDSHIKDSLLENVSSLVEEILGHVNKMTKYVERLSIVRTEKENRTAYIFDDISDSVSDTSSTSSLRTKSFQSKSSRNTKKMNRKIWSLKEGNPREEEALVATLSQIISSSEKYVGEVNLSCSLLLLFGEDHSAAKLQAVMEDWINLIDKSKKLIWPQDQESNEASILDQKFKYPPEVNIKSDWEFHVLKR